MCCLLLLLYLFDLFFSFVAVGVGGFTLLLCCVCLVIWFVCGLFAIDSLACVLANGSV